MKKLLFTLVALVLLAPVARGTDPGHPFCVFSTDALYGVILCPDVPGVINQSIIFMTIRDRANNPMPDVPINLEFGTGPLCICSTMSFNTVTDVNGTASLTLRGGGCIHDQDRAVTIRVNGISEREYRNAKSPDWDGAAGNCSVNLGDVVRFVSHDLCFDFGNDGGVDLSDFVIFGAGYTSSHHCP